MEQVKNMQELPVQESTVKSFVQKNRINAKNNGRVDCGDGRFDIVQTDGSLRAFGGDAGFIEPAVAAFEEKDIHVTPEDYKEAYLRAKAKMYGDNPQANTDINVHADSHHPGQPLLACGYIVHSIDTEEAGKAAVFGPYMPQTREVMQYIVGNSNHVAITDVAQEIHEEKAVLFVYSDAYTVASHDVGNTEMYFVVDMQRAIAYAEKLWPLLVNELKELGITNADTVSVSEYKKWFERYMVATASILAHGKQIFDVRFDDQGTATVEAHKELPEVPTQEAYADLLRAA